MEATTFVLFGATGDLARRKIYPALYNLFLDRKLHDSFAVIGLGRREVADEAYQAMVERSLRDFSRREVKDTASVRSFLKAFRYNVLDVGHTEDYVNLLERVEQLETSMGSTPNRMFYLSVGPEFLSRLP